MIKIEAKGTNYNVFGWVKLDFNQLKKFITVINLFGFNLKLYESTN